MTVLLVTGTRHGRHDVEHWLDLFVARRGVPELVVLGDSHLWVDERGVDLQAYEWCKYHGYRYKQELALSRLKSPARYHERDQRMANHVGPGDWALGFPVADSRGTWLTLSMCRKRGASAVACPVWRASRVLE